MMRFALLAGILTACGSASAQPEAAAPVTPTEAAAESDALSAVEVTAAAQQVTTALARMRARVHHVRELEHHEAVILGLGRELGRLRIDSDLDALETQPRRELRSLREQWAELDARILTTADALELSAIALAEDAVVLEAMRGLWESTAERARAESYPETPTQRIVEIRALIDGVTAELRVHLERVLAAQTRLAKHAIATGDVLAQLDGAIETSQARIFSRTHAPGLGGTPGRAPVSLLHQLEVAAIHHAHALERFIRHTGTRGWVHVSLTIALLLLLHWLRRDHRLGPAGTAAGSPLVYPVTTTILVALLLVRTLHPLAPRAVVELAQLLALGPLLTLARAPRLRDVTRIAAALYALDWARLLLDEHDFEHRVLLFVTAAAAGVGMAVKARSAEGMLRAAWGLASLLSLVGLVAGLLGFVPLAGVLVEGSVASALTGALLAASYRAAAVTLEAALSTRLAENTVLGRHREVTQQSLLRAARVSCLVAFVWIALDYFRLRSAVVAQVELALSETVELGDIDISFGGVLAFALGIWAAVIVSRVLSRTLQEDVAPRLALGPGVPAAAALIVRYTVLGVGFMLAASAAGIGLAQLSLFAGALGVGVGFGLQNVVSNFVSGLLLVFERPVKVGDTLDISGFRGTVTEIGVRSSTIRAVSGADIIIPNSKLIEGPLVNWTHTDATLRVEFPVGVAYENDVRHVQETLLAAAATVPAALKSPGPSVLLTKFGADSIDFEVRIWIANAPEMSSARSVLGFTIQEALEREDIQFPAREASSPVKP